MFVFDKSKFYEKSRDNLPEFIDCWKNYYKKGKIDYIKELNLKNDLTTNNLNALLQWKDPRFLATKYSSELTSKLPIINEFRKKQVTEVDIKNSLKGIWKNGLIYPVFILHIARPFEYPLADVNVFHSFSAIEGKFQKDKRSNFTEWAEYDAYKKFFFDLAIRAKIIAERPTGQEDKIEDIVKELKELDNVLLTYGQFLINYG